jgi:hypothetical protein
MRNSALCIPACQRSQDRAVGVVATLCAGKSKNDGSIASNTKGFFSCPKHPEQLWGTYSLLVNLYEEI